MGGGSLALEIRVGGGVWRYRKSGRKGGSKTLAIRRVGVWIFSGITQLRKKVLGVTVRSEMRYMYENQTIPRSVPTRPSSEKGYSITAVSALESWFDVQ